MPLLDAINNKLTSTFNPAKPGNVPKGKITPTPKIEWGNWRDKLVQASFRTATFSVLSTSSEGGRRTVLHQFPFDDIPYLEDMGKEANTYQIQAFVVSNTSNNQNYFTDRNALIKALEAFGAGTLIHPFLGTKKVGLQGKYKLDESFSDGGVARFTFTFVDAGKTVSDAATPPPSVESVADKVQNKALGTYDKFLNAIKTAQEVTAFTKSALNAASNLANEIYSGINSIQTTVVGVISAGQTFVASVRGTYASVVKFPSQFKAAIKNTFSVYQSIGAHIPAGNTSHVSAMLRLASKAPAALPAATTPSQIASNNATYLLNNAKLAGNLAEAVRAAANVEYTSYEQAKGVLTDITDTINSVLAYIGTNFPDDELSAAIEDMRPVITSILLSKGASLPPTRIIEVPSDVTPALVVAQQLYGDYTRDTEVISMNSTKLRHPGFAPSGNTIQVLST